jgi:hypothetical protein
MANQIIPAADVAPMIYRMLVQAVENEYEGSTQEEKEQALRHIVLLFNLDPFFRLKANNLASAF